MPELSDKDLEIHEGGGTASLTYLSLYEDTDALSVGLKRENMLNTLSRIRWLWLG